MWLGGRCHAHTLSLVSQQVLGPACSLQPSGFLSLSPLNLHSPALAVAHLDSLDAYGMDQMALVLVNVEDVCRLTRWRRLCWRYHLYTYTPLYMEINYITRFCSVFYDRKVKECLGNRNGNWLATVYQSSLLLQAIILVMGLNRF